MKIWPSLVANSPGRCLRRTRCLAQSEVSYPGSTAHRPATRRPSWRLKRRRTPASRIKPYFFLWDPDNFVPLLTTPVKIKKGEDWALLPVRPGNRTKEMVRRGILLIDKPHPFGNMKVRALEIPKTE